jgi:Calcineurin-like phosphoesterase
MILELMQHRYLAESTDETGLKLRECIAAVERMDPAMARLVQDQQVTLADLRSALERTEQAAAVLAMPAESEATFFPREPISSQMQSVLQRYFIDRGLTQRREASGAIDVTHPISDVSLVPAVAMKAPDQLFGAMSQTDTGWVACLAAKAYRSFGNKRAFPKDPPAPKQIASDARIFLLADWGSGISRAKKIADRIHSMLDAEGARDQHVIHLGDVYYSGWPEEYDDHFLPNWPVKPGKEGAYGSWSINSNHEMFSGGYGYFDHLLLDARFKNQQGRSFFALENTHWQLLGLDSAWEDEDLAGDQFAWVEHRQAAHPKKKLLLMTHHQPFSAFENDCVKLQRLLARNKVTAWFWGHEHRFAMYKTRPDLPYGRLIGHGGVPVWARPKSKPVPDSVHYVSTNGFRSGIERFALFGFAVLDFDGPSIGVRYFDEYGAIEQSEIIR